MPYDQYGRYSRDSGVPDIFTQHEQAERARVEAESKQAAALADLALYKQLLQSAPTQRDYVTMFAMQHGRSLDQQKFLESLGYQPTYDEAEYLRLIQEGHDPVETFHRLNPAFVQQQEARAEVQRQRQATHERFSQPSQHGASRKHWRRGHELPDGYTQVQSESERKAYILGDLEQRLSGGQRSDGQADSLGRRYDGQPSQFVPAEPVNVGPSRYSTRFAQGNGSAGIPFEPDAGGV